MAGNKTLVLVEIADTLDDHVLDSHTDLEENSGTAEVIKKTPPGNIDMHPSIRAVYTIQWNGGMQHTVVAPT
jgi:hypothetical protein